MADKGSAQWHREHGHGGSAHLRRQRGAGLFCLDVPGSGRWLGSIHTARRPALSQGREGRRTVVPTGSVGRCGCNSSKRAQQRPAPSWRGARISTAAPVVCFGFQRSWTLALLSSSRPVVLLPLLPSLGKGFPHSACGYREKERPGEHHRSLRPQLCGRGPRRTTSAPATRSWLVPPPWTPSPAVGDAQSSATPHVPARPSR